MFLQQSPVVNLYWLDQIHSDQLRTVGVKALHLSLLKQKGCPVVPGFVVASRVLQVVLESIHWEIPLLADFPSSALRINIDNAKQLQAIAQHLRQAINSAPLPETLLNDLERAAKSLPSPTFLLHPSLVVDVPSHLAAQQPLPDGVFHPSGLIDSYISDGHADSLAHQVKQLWGDLYGAKSLFYWQRMGIPLHQVKLAILIQPLQPAIASGTLRSVNNHLELCATTGLGAALNRSDVLPDVYQIQTETGVILSQELGQKSVGYQINSPSVSDSLSENIDRDRMEMYLLDDHERLTYSLTKSQVDQVVQLAQAAWQGLGISIGLEWVLLPDQSGTPQAYVTHIAPETLLPVLPPATKNASSQSRKGIELFPDAILIATGVAASSGHAIAPASVLRDLTTLPDKIPPYTVLIAPTIPLDWMHLVQQAAGLVSEQGSLTSHSAIVAREIGVPAVTGVSGATQRIQSGDLIWVDGDRGHVYCLPRSTKVPTTLESQPTKSLPLVLSNQRTATKTKLWVNISLPEQLTQTTISAVDGIGLLRSELLALAVLDHQHPLRWLQQNQEQEFVDRMATVIAQFAEVLQSRPILYRSFDLRPHEFSNLERIDSAGSNSMLGVRGTHRYLMDATLFKLELQALLAVRQMGYSNVHLKLPFVRTVEEFQFCRQLVQQAGLMQQSDFQLWIMAEVPSVLLLLSDYVEAGVQGISIGTNDLTQLLLGVNRDDAQLTTAFDERHPAVKRAIAQLIREARSLQIPCSICGEAPARYPELIADLIHWGIDSISVSPEAVAATHQEIIKAEGGSPQLV